MMNLNGLTKIFTGNGGSGNGRFFSFHPLGAVNTRQPAPCIVDEGRNVIDGSVESKENKIAEKNV